MIREPSDRQTVWLRYRLHHSTVQQQSSQHSAGNKTTVDHVYWWAFIIDKCLTWPTPLLSGWVLAQLVKEPRADPSAQEKVFSTRKSWSPIQPTWPPEGKWSMKNTRCSKCLYLVKSGSLCSPLQSQAWPGCLRQLCRSAGRPASYCQQCSPEFNKRD